jgi:hypothetical protein
MILIITIIIRYAIEIIVDTDICIDLVCCGIIPDEREDELVTLSLDMYRIVSCSRR